MEWIYSVMTLADLRKIDREYLSHPIDEIVVGIENPRFLALHGSCGAPPGCIYPKDAAYWRVIQHEQLIDFADETTGWISWRPVDPTENAFQYACRRWYVFAINGMSLVSRLMFSLKFDNAFSELIVKNRWGLIDIVYDGDQEKLHSSTDFTLWRPPSKEDWVRRVKKRLGDRAIIDHKGYEVVFTDSQVATDCGILCAISPFEAEWLMRVSISKEQYVLWRGFGIGDDYGDLCLCHAESDSEWLAERLRQYCRKKNIRLYYSSQWNMPMFDDDGNEIFPPPDCQVVVE